MRDTKGERARAQDRPMGEKRLSGEWWVQAARPPKISAPEMPLVLAFLETLAGSAFQTRHVSKQRVLGLAVGQVRNASLLGVSVLGGNAAGCGVSKRVKSRNTFASSSVCDYKR